VFLPVTMDSAERIMETIQEIKQKIPSDPFEAEIILMAEMVAEQNEKTDKGKGPKEKKVSEKEKPEAAAPGSETNSIFYYLRSFRKKEMETGQSVHQREAQI